MVWGWTNKWGVMAITQELKQIYDLQTFRTMDADSLIEEEKQKAIPSLMLLKKRNTGQSKQENMQMVPNKENI